MLNYANMLTRSPQKATKIENSKDHLLGRMTAKPFIFVFFLIEAYYYCYSLRIFLSYKFLPLDLQVNLVK